VESRKLQGAKGVRPDAAGRCQLHDPYRSGHPEQGHYIHPGEDRGLSTHEMAALQSFPSDWVFQAAKGGRLTLASAERQIGNAVPPLLARAVGLALRTGLEGTAGYLVG